MSQPKRCNVTFIDALSWSTLRAEEELRSITDFLFHNSAALTGAQCSEVGAERRAIREATALHRRLCVLDAQRRRLSRVCHRLVLVSVASARYTKVV